MVTWKFISNRRRLKLEEFLSGVSTLPAALALFSARGITPPSVDEIEQALANKAPNTDTQEEEKPVEVPAVDSKPEDKVEIEAEGHAAVVTPPREMKPSLRRKRSTNARKTRAEKANDEGVAEE